VPTVDTLTHVNFRAQPASASPENGRPTRGVSRTRSRDGVLSIKPFRALWIALSLSSLGDWLSILALTELAANLTKSGVAQNSAVGGVWIVTLLPALLLGPIAGALADRFDRRITMIVGDVVRGLLFLSIPLFPNLTWIFVAKFLAGVTSQFWNPAAAASVPNLVPREKLERANQLSQLMTYGTAPLAAGVFAVLTYAANGLGHVAPIFRTNNVDLALYFNAASYLVSAITVYFLRQIGKREHSGPISVPSTAKAIWEGWRFIGQTPVVRGLVIGMLGAFSAAGVVVGLAVPYIKSTLRGGSAGWALVFAAIFVGMALGMGFGSRLFGPQFSRRRLFGLTLTVSAVPLALIGLVPNLDLLVVFVLLMGFTSGIAYPTGFTIVGLEVDDDTRGRVFAFFQSTIQVILLAVIGAAPFIAGGLTAAIQAITGARNGDVRVWHITYASAGQNLLFLLSALLVAYVGIKSYRQLDDRKGVPLREDLVAAFRGEELRRVDGPEGADEGIVHGLFVAFEGGEGSGKTTQARQLAIWLREQGYEVVTTHEPGATKVGMRLRALLLDRNHAGLSPRAEALMYAADRAEHVQSVIEPALARDAVVITDRYVDSSLAYQGAGRGLLNAEIERLNRWATGGRMPDLTVLLDMPPESGLSRRTVSADRLEAEPLEFHRRVRAGFLALARAESSRYLVIDATQSQEEVARVIKDRVQEILPDPVPKVAEAVTSSFPMVQ
jgi:dTMP kinase